MTTTETTSLLEFTDQVKPETSLGERSARRYLAKIHRCVTRMLQGMDEKIPLYERAILAGTLLIAVFQLMIALRLDPLGCIRLAKDPPDEKGSGMLQVRTTVTQG